MNRTRGEAKRDSEENIIDAFSLSLSPTHQTFKSTCPTFLRLSGARANGDRMCDGSGFECDGPGATDFQGTMKLETRLTMCAQFSLPWRAKSTRHSRIVAWSSTAMLRASCVVSMCLVSLPFDATLRRQEGLLGVVDEFQSGESKKAEGGGNHVIQ